jgi:hypothetical protein
VDDLERDELVVARVDRADKEEGRVAAVDDFGICCFSYGALCKRFALFGKLALSV